MNEEIDIIMNFPVNNVYGISLSYTFSSTAINQGRTVPNNATGILICHFVPLIASEINFS